MRLRFRPWDYLTSSLLGSVLAVGLTIPAVTLFDLGVEGVLAAGAIGMAAAALFGIAKAWSLIWSGLSLAHLREMLTYGLPLVPGLLSIWAMAYADRIILAVSAGSDDVGLYAIANRVAQPISLLATAIAVAYHPLMLDVARDRPDDERRLRRQVATATLILGLGISVILVALGPEIVRAVAPGYEDATESIGPLAVGLTLYALVSILVGSFLLLRRTALTAAFTVLAGAASVLLCIALVPTLGAFGAALGTAGGYALLAGSYLWFGLRHDPEAHDPRRLGQVFAIGVATIGVAGILSETTDGPMSFLARLGCVVIFAAALLAFRVVTPSLLSALARLVRNPQG
jgi:O-antigen/teichoic acid export membrane protein